MPELQVGVGEWKIFQPWVAVLNAKLKRENREGIFFLDNFSGHVMGVEQYSTDDLSKLRIEWLPGNCTRICQPVDQGIGQAMKIRYRKYLHEYMANMVFAGKPPMTMVNILKACTWLARAWNSLNNTNTAEYVLKRLGSPSLLSPLSMMSWARKMGVL